MNPGFRAEGVHGWGSISAVAAESFVECGLTGASLQHGCIAGTRAVWRDDKRLFYYKATSLLCMCDNLLWSFMWNRFCLDHAEVKWHWLQVFWCHWRDDYSKPHITTVQVQLRVHACSKQMGVPFCDLRSVVWIWPLDLLITSSVERVNVRDKARKGI